MVEGGAGRVANKDRERKERERVARLHKLLRPFMLRRLKKDVEKQVRFWRWALACSWLLRLCHKSARLQLEMDRCIASVPFRTALYCFCSLPYCPYIAFSFSLDPA